MNRGRSANLAATSVGDPAATSQKRRIRRSWRGIVEGFQSTRVYFAGDRFNERRR